MAVLFLVIGKLTSFIYSDFAFSALTLLVGRTRMSH